MRTKILTIFLAIMTTSLWAADFKSGDLYYNIVYSGGRDIAYVAESETYQSLTSVIIPETVTYDGETYSVELIGEQTFYGCSLITSVSIGNNVKKIPTMVFAKCSSLTTVEIGDNVTSVSSSAFNGCTSLTAINMGANVTSIGHRAFGDCFSLKAITISSTTTDIENNAFAGCSFIRENFINNSALNAEEENYWGATIANEEFDGLLTRNDTIVACRPYVTSVTIPHYVTHIESAVFYNCPLLTTIVWNAKRSSPLFWGGGTNGLGASMPTYDPFGQWHKTGGDDIRHQITSITFGDSVEYIPASLCLRMENLTSVTIPNSVKGIGYRAFSNCKALVSVSLPEHLEEIGKEAFRNCDVLPNIVLPNSVTAIGEQGFSDCDALERITIPSNVTSIGKKAFEECMFAESNFINNSSLNAEENGYWGAIIGDEEIEGMLLKNDTVIDCRRYISSATIPDGVTTIGIYAFYECANLASVTIPDGVIAIGKYAFGSCANLTSITIPNSVKSIGRDAFIGSALYEDESNWQDGVLYIDNYLIKARYNTPITDYGIKDNTLVIADEAFDDHRQLTSITIPNSVTHIGKRAFSSCDYLISVNVSASVTNIGDDAFEYCTNLSEIILPENSQMRSIGNGAFEYCRSLASISIPNNVLNIGGSAFRNTSLTSVIIPDNVTSLGEKAFYYCPSLISAIVGNGIKSINNYTFHGCSSLTDITLPEGLNTIGKGAFNDCTSLSSIVIPNSVRDIGEYAFALTALDEVAIPDSVESIVNYTFMDCSNLATVTIGRNVKSIGSWAFQNCKAISSVIWNAINCIDVPYLTSRDKFTSFIIGENVEHIPAYLCSGMNKLATITIPQSVKSIGENAFNNCVSLVEANYAGEVADWCKVKLGNATSNPNYYAKNFFVNGQEVMEVEVPNDVDSIYAGAFYGCTKLSSLVIPESVTSIGEEAFGECRRLYGIYCYATVPPVASENSFANYNVNLYVPSESLRDYQMDMVFGSFKFIQPIVSDEYYSITYIVDGEVYATDSVLCGESIVLIDAPTKEGYTFSGWSEAPETMPAENVTISGTFTVNTYKVYYYVGDELVHTAEVAYGEAIPEYVYEPTEEGYTFLGWVGDTYETMPAHDVTYTANIDDAIEQLTIDNSQLIIYDLTGRKVTDTQNQRGGIYIVNGKKVVIK